jgi:hypothetical protein
MQEDKGGKAKAYQVQQLVTAIERWLRGAGQKAGEAKKAEAGPASRRPTRSRLDEPVPLLSVETSTKRRWVDKPIQGTSVSAAKANAHP